MRTCASNQQAFTSRAPPVSARPSRSSNATVQRSTPFTVRSCKPFISDTATQPAVCQRRQTACDAGLATAGAAGMAASPEIRTACEIAATFVVVAACVRNVPQLLHCWRRKSTEGISVTSLITEISCYSAMIAYMSRSAYSVLIWGSEAACWVQDSSLLLMVAILRQFPLGRTMAIGTVWMALQALLLSPVMPIWILAKFQILAGLVLGLGARLPQIVLNHKNGHTGNLAPHTFIFNLTANCINGVCATVLTGDILVIATQVWMFSLNCTVVSQIWRSNRRRRAASALALAQHPNLDDGRVSYSRVSLEGEPQREGAWPRLA